MKNIQMVLQAYIYMTIIIETAFDFKTINVGIKDVCREMLESKRLIMSKPQLSFSEELYRIHSNKLATLYTPKRRHKSIDDTKKC
ncbi:hypothetical protein [Staphylococcus xylosus]